MAKIAPMIRECPRCHTTSFVSDGECKECGRSLSVFEGRKSLEPCPDCDHLCSLVAETCPNCGRALRLVRHQPTFPLIKVLIGAVLVLLFGYIAYPILFQAKREAEVQSAVLSGEPAKAGISEKNRAAANAALNALGEIQSVTSVGTNYSQYTSALQNARIKYDSALRDLKPLDESEFTILTQLEEVFQCYIDAKDAWTEFIKHGDSYGFVSEQNLVVKRLSQTYGFSASTDAGFYNSTVLSTIWAAASGKFNTVEVSLR